jgi:hypothetical protein
VDGHEFIHSSGSRAWRNNNPGNLTSSEKSGLSIGKGGRFAVFATPEDGMAALKYALTHFYADLTLDKVFKKYAPSTDNNDPERYIKLVKQFSGLDSAKKLGDLTEADLQKFMSAIKRVEGWSVGKIDPVPYAQQFAIKSIDEKPFPGLSYIISFFTSSGEERKITGTTDAEGKTAVVKSDTRTPVTLKLPRPDPGQSLKGTGVKTKAATPKAVLAAEVRAKPWYECVWECVAESSDERDIPSPQASSHEIQNRESQADQTKASAAGTSSINSTAPNPYDESASGAAASQSKAPLTTVKQMGAVKASGTKEKSQNYIEGVVKESGVYVTWQFDTSAGSRKVLNGLPYFVAEMSGSSGKALVENQRVHLMRDNKIRQKVPFGKEVALYLGNDAKLKYHTTPLFRVKAEEGLTDIVIKIVETRGPKYDESRELPHDEIITGTKKTFSAVLYGQTWMKFSHKFTGTEASAEGADEIPEIVTAMQQIYTGCPTASTASISLLVNKPNRKAMKIIWPKAAFENCIENIATVVTLEDAKNEIIPRVHPQTYKAFLKAAFELDAEELEINSGWRPMLGSVLHRIGVGLDVGRIKAAGENNTFRRAATAAETEYFKLISEKRVLSAKKTLTDEETKRLNEITAIESSKAMAATSAIHDNESEILRSFTKKLRINGDVKQTFDPWEMDVNTGDTTPAIPNRLVTGNEVLHKTHLHITVRDSELGH